MGQVIVLAEVRAERERVAVRVQFDPFGLWVAWVAFWMGAR